jgi:tetratricopeptide repeat protein 21B
MLMCTYVQKLPYNAAEGDAHENALLLLAKINLGVDKLEQAEACAAACLAHNASAAGVHELLAAVSEKRGNAVAAAEQYKKAWQLSCGSDPALGYRLAWNLLKCVRYTQAIDVALEVLRRFPDYPKIEADVLKPALARLRAGSERDELRRLEAATPATIAAA